MCRRHRLLRSPGGRQLATSRAPRRLAPPAQEAQAASVARPVPTIGSDSFAGRRYRAAGSSADLGRRHGAQAVVLAVRPRTTRFGSPRVRDHRGPTGAENACTAVADPTHPCHVRPGGPDTPFPRAGPPAKGHIRDSALPRPPCRCAHPAAGTRPVPAAVPASSRTAAPPATSAAAASPRRPGCPAGPGPGRRGSGIGASSPPDS